jgi:hypothetical protein
MNRYQVKYGARDEQGYVNSAFIGYQAASPEQAVYQAFDDLTDYGITVVRIYSVQMWDGTTDTWIATVDAKALAKVESWLEEHPTGIVR